MARTSVVFRLQAAAKVHREILQGGYPSATRLGEVLQASPKTVRAYLGVLRDAFGFEPVYDPQRHGYHYPHARRSVLLPRLSADEVVAVFVMEQAARALKTSPLRPILESALNKFSLMLPTGCGMSADDFSACHSLRFERAAQRAEPGLETLGTVWRALAARRRLQIEYRARPRGAKTLRKIDPLHLTYCEGQWYLVTFCHLRREIRTFVPARILAIKILDEEFSPPEGFDAEKHFRSAFGIVAGQNVAPVVLRFGAGVAQIIRERHWHTTQRLEELADGGIRLHLTCSQGDELRSWVMSWGQQVVVESPIRLAREIAEAHQRAAGMYLEAGAQR